MNDELNSHKTVKNICLTNQINVMAKILNFYSK